MSEQPGATPPREDDETNLFAGVPGPSGTGTRAVAGADPDARPDHDARPDPDARPDQGAVPSQDVR